MYCIPLTSSFTRVRVSGLVVGKVYAWGHTRVEHRHEWGPISHTPDNPSPIELPRPSEFLLTLRPSFCTTCRISVVVFPRASHSPSRISRYSFRLFCLTPSV